MNTYLEYILFGVICFFPFMFIAYYPLRYFLRFSTKITFFLEIAFSIPEVLLFVMVSKFFPDFYMLAVAALAIFNILAYVFLYKITFGRILFNLLLIVNIANFTIVFARLLELILFPQVADQPLHWTYSICVLITEAVFVLPTFLFIKHFSDSMIRNSDYDYIWRVAWLIPMFLSILGFVFIYSPSIQADTMIGSYIKKSTICAVYLVYLLLSYSFIARLIRTQHNVLMLKQNLYYQSIQKMQLHKIETQIQETRVLRHDLRHHLRLMSNYVEQEEYDNLKEYLQQYSDSMQNISQLNYTNNTLFNTLLVYYADLCRSGHIEFDARIALPDTLSLPDNEITIIVSNLLENAYHACLEMDEKLSHYIRVNAAYKSNQFLLIVIENSYTNKTKQDSLGNFLSTKPDGNGIGLSSVKDIVTKYDGCMDISTEDNCFSVSISINIIQ